jgi:hypothetical protein
MLDGVQHLVQRHQPRPGKQRPRRRGVLVHGPGRCQEAGPAAPGTRAHCLVRE